MTYHVKIGLLVIIYAAVGHMAPLQKVPESRIICTALKKQNKGPVEYTDYLHLVIQSLNTSIHTHTEIQLYAL